MAIVRGIRLEAVKNRLPIDYASSPLYVFEEGWLDGLGVGGFRLFVSV